MHLLIALLIFTVFYTTAHGNLPTREDYIACPKGSVINGFQLKLETKRGVLSLDHGVTELIFFCNPPDGNTLSIDNKIVIYNDSPYGYWRSIQWCPKGSVIIGITEKIDSEKFDNAGITNFGARCGRPEDRTEQPSFLFAKLYTHGKWTLPESWCDVGSALASFNPRFTRRRGLESASYGCRKV